MNQNSSLLGLSFEVVIIPVTDPDESIVFYRDKLGFSVDVDYAPNDAFRVVQVTPPGSGVSLQFGTGLTTAATGIGPFYVVVADIEQAHRQLVERGIDVEPIRHKSPIDDWSGSTIPGIDPHRRDYASLADFADPDGNLWTLQERGHGLGAQG